MAGSGRKTADSALIAALASGATRAQAAKTAGVGENTVYRRLRDPDFTAHLDEARGEYVRQTVARLSASATAAASTLYALLSSDSDTVRLGAARSIIELSVKMRESEELEKRVTELEERMSA